MQKPLISIIVPCYNQAEYLDECLQSVLNQTYSNWECIIVNDGSPDDTEKVAMKWTVKDNRFKYLKKENGGLSSARNAGIKIAKGEWILPLDCDDKIGYQYLELAQKEFSDEKGIIYAKAEFFGSVNSDWNLPDFELSKIYLNNYIYCSAFFKKSDWNLIGGFDQNLRQGREDWEFWINLLSTTKKNVKRINYVGFYYRRKEESMDTVINSNSDIMFNAELYIYNKHAILYKNYGNPIENIVTKEKMKNLQQKLDTLQTSIRKNYLTKFLYKIIEIL